MLTIYGRANSSNVQAVMWTVGELGLEHERIDVGGAFGGTDTPHYLAMNPNGLVPAMKDGDLTLFESAAIIRYLGARYGNAAFWPADPEERAPIDMWAEWAKTTFNPPFLHGIFQALMWVRPADQDQAALAASAGIVARQAAIAEAQLTRHAYLASDDLTIADIVFATMLYRYFTLPFERIETPNLDAYYKRLTGRTAYAEHVMVSYDDLRAR